ncbi:MULTISPECIES: hypothetical protein [Oceanobacillus]|uniref:hypothetical protein n=1 Tax=Oceanobacillus TaxID=182709 RepID=UPI0005962A2D|nr:MULTISPECIES: hypothetical protein [Oceanobacillus]
MGLDMYLLSVPKIDIPNGKTVRTEKSSFTIHQEDNVERLFLLNRFINYHVTDSNHLVNYPEVLPYIEKDSFWGFSIMKKIAYWREARGIHNWFLENVLDGKNSYEGKIVTEADIQNLLEDIIVFLEAKKIEMGEVNSESSPNGLIFNGNYEQRYICELDYSQLMLKKILNQFDFDNYHLVYLVC